jgi:hypothetical protein
MNTNTAETKESDAAKQKTGEGCSGATCSASCSELLENLEEWGEHFREMQHGATLSILRAKKTIQDLAAHAAAMESVLRGLMENPHIDLGDKIYEVREREGEGWDGKHVKAWSDAVAAAQKILGQNA